VIEAAGQIGLPFVLTSTETGAAIAALAQAEITGEPGACITTLGPGAASAVNGIACAFLERAPMFVFTDSHAAAANKFTHQRLDHHALLKDVTRFSGSLVPDPASAVGQALTSMQSSPGPVHIDCPGDLAAIEAPLKWASLWLKPYSERIDPRAAPLFSESRRPLVIAGLAARRQEDVAAIRAFCERHNVPAMVTYKAKGVVPDDHPLFGGVFTNGSIERPLVDESDLILAVGLDPVELLPRPWSYRQPVVYFGRDLPDGASQIPIAAFQTWLTTIESLMQPTTWDREKVHGHVDAARERVRVPASGMTASQVVGVAAAKLARDCRVTVDAGAHMFPATMLWPVREPNQMLISNGLSTMGFSLPAAIGAALLERDRPVVALIGDGGLLICMGELATAVRERLKIIVLLFSDASLSLIEIKQQARKLRPSGVALGDMDWPAIARGFGMAGLVATNASELDQAIQTALRTSGPTLIEAKIDRSNYGQVLKAVRG
jgi:acetolactate synthase-1/2/3 large subunit